MKKRLNIKEVLLVTILLCFLSGPFLLPGDSSACGEPGSICVSAYDHIPNIEWCRGCCPTSIAMVLGYWNEAYSGMFRLYDFWVSLTQYALISEPYSQGYGPLMNVPNVLEELRVEMKTSVTGITSGGAITPGIEAVANADRWRNHYGFKSGEMFCSSSGNDWCWDYVDGSIRKEIDEGHPFVWLPVIHIPEEDLGHCLCAFGYTANKFVITYNTWNAGEDWWQYDMYNNQTNLDSAAVYRVHPGGWTWGATRLEAPNGGETWENGQMKTISWHEEDARNWMHRLYYSTDGGIDWTFLTTYDATTPGWRSWDWRIPLDMLTTEYARVKVETFSGNDAEGWTYQGGAGSRSNFTINHHDRSLSVSSPYAGQMYYPGEPMNIAWSSLEAGSTVDIDISRHGVWEEIATGTLNDGSHSWTVSSTGSDDCHVRVKSSQFPALQAMSTGPFAIKGLTVTSPNGDETWYVGDVQTIAWTKADVSNFQVQISRDGGFSYNAIADVASGDSYAWMVTGPPSPACLVKVISTSQPGMSDISDASFTIAVRSLDVTSPNGGESWRLGKSNKITWTSQSAGKNVKIEISRDGGSVWSSVVEATPNSGSFTWTSVSGPPSKTCRIRVTSIEYPSISDISNADFTIKGLTVTAPNGGETWYVGDLKTITWTKAGASNFQVQISRNDGISYNAIANVPSGDSYSWKVTGPMSPECLVKVISTSQPEISDISDRPFTIMEKRPDLKEISIADPPATALPGGSFSVTDSTKNQGNRDSGHSTTRYYLSLDTVPGWDDILLKGGRYIRMLPVGATSSGTATVTIPAMTSEGEYYLLACADYGNRIVETDESNNCRESSGKVQITFAQADLSVFMTDSPDPVGIGSELRYDLSVTNAGPSSATTVILTDMLPAGVTFVSATSGCSQSDGMVTCNIGSLPGTATLYQTIIVKPTAAGAITNIAKVSAFGSDPNPANNTVSISTTVQGPRPDLTVGSVVAGPGTAIPGGSLSVTETTSNIGDGDAGKSTTCYYLSLDQRKGPGDISLAGSRSVAELAAGASTTGTVAATIPTATPAGGYNVLACADDPDAVRESNEANNCGAFGTVLILADLPDLIISSLSNPPAAAAPGDSFPVADTVANRGAGGAGASTIEYFLSTDAGGQGRTIKTGSSRFVQVLAAGASSTDTATVTVPTTIYPGTYQLRARADSLLAVTETNESNNEAGSNTAVQISGELADLVVFALTTDNLDVVPGQTININDTTRNQGTGTVPGTPTRFYWSADMTLDASDTYLGWRPVPSLAPGTSSGPVTTALVVPAGAGAETYYLIAKADAPDYYAETDENNNTRSLAIRVGPDLLVSALEVPASGTPGQSVSVTYQVKNRGAANAGTSTVSFYLSADKSWEGGDTLLLSQLVPALPGAGTYGDTVSLTLPAATPPGAYFILGMADSGNVVAEAVEKNNRAARPITVN